MSTELCNPAEGWFESLIVPFERHDRQGPAVPADYVGGHQPTNEMDEIMSSGNTLPACADRSGQRGAREVRGNGYSKTACSSCRTTSSCRISARTFRWTSMTGQARGIPHGILSHVARTSHRASLTPKNSGPGYSRPLPRRLPWTWTASATCPKRRSQTPNETEDFLVGLRG